MQILEIWRVFQWRVEGCLSARLLFDLTAVSVKEPTRDRCGRPPSHLRAISIFRPRSLVNSLAHDSHICDRLSIPTSASVDEFVLVVLWISITMLFLVEIIRGGRSHDSSPCRHGALLVQYDECPPPPPVREGYGPSATSCGICGRVHS